MKPPEVLTPEDPTTLRPQYEAADPDRRRGANTPVRRKRTSWPSTRSRSWSTSPGDRCNSVAADDGSAAGMSGPAGAVGQWPASSTAREAMPLSDPAWISGTFPWPALAGPAGSEPATSPSGSDQ